MAFEPVKISKNLQKGTHTTVKILKQKNPEEHRNKKIGVYVWKF